MELLSPQQIVALRRIARQRGITIEAAVANAVAFYLQNLCFV